MQKAEEFTFLDSMTCYTLRVITLSCANHYGQDGQRKEGKRMNAVL